MPQSDITSKQRETGLDLMPKFDGNGLITAVVSQAGSGDPLMVAHMNREALELTLETGEAHFYSRSRAEIWHKGGTSGNVLAVSDIRIDCDQDAVWLSVEAKGHGAACHTGRETCFFRRIQSADGTHKLEMTGHMPLFDPKSVHGSQD